MKIKRFTAANMQAGLKSISETLGPEAVILSNRRIADGLEIVAGVDEQEFELFQQSMQVAEPESDIIKAQPNAADSLDKDTMQQLFSVMSKKNKKAFGFESNSVSVGAEPSMSQPSKPAKPAYKAKQPVQANVQKPNQQQVVFDDDIELQEPALTQTAPAANHEDIAMLRREIDGLKDLLKEQTEQLAEPTLAPVITPHYERIESRLDGLGFTDSIVRKLMAHYERDESVDQNWRKMLGRLVSAIPTPMYEPLATGGIFALTGPTGAGKTTTIAKLAAHAVKDYGTDSVAVISLDWYQVGGQEILRSVTDILGVEFKAMNEKDNLLKVLNSLKSKRLVLIDTSGSQEALGHWNKLMAQDVLNRYIQTLLVLPATMAPSAVNQFILHHRQSAFVGTILTKLDESACFGGVLEPVLKHRWPLWYCTTGQNIPQDIEVVDARKLVRRLAAGIAPNETQLATAS